MIIEAVRAGPYCRSSGRRAAKVMGLFRIGGDERGEFGGERQQIRRRDGGEVRLGRSDRETICGLESGIIIRHDRARLRGSEFAVLVELRGERNGGVCGLPDAQEGLDLDDAGGGRRSTARKGHGSCEGEAEGKEKAFHF